jgi:organic hydroperoxide reductase OsmC/OhrA
METFTAHLDWTGAAMGPTRDHVSFSRDLAVTAGSTTLPMSSAPRFRGDPARMNPEQLFVAAISSCHALTYLFLAGRAGIAVSAYSDDAEGTLGLVDGRLRMSQVVLHPRITLEPGANEAEARELIEKAHRDCFIGNSVSSETRILPTFLFAERQSTAA